MRGVSDFIINKWWEGRENRGERERERGRYTFLHRKSWGRRYVVGQLAARLEDGKKTI